LSHAHISVRRDPPGSRQDPHEACQSAGREIADTLARIGDKWTVMVVGTLFHGAMRYNEIRRAIDGISQRMLTLTLKGLEKDGLVTRTVFPTIPPRVDYELTDLGRSLRDPLKALHDWATEHRPAMVEARRQYEARLANKPRW
jgi:DNA-binding HxlR family transcriptional regulator